VRRKVTVAASRLTVALSPSDLVHTWLCISCPWVVLGEGEGAVALVVLRGRAGRERRGTDRILLRGVPVDGGRLVLRLAEREHEVTRLEGLRVRVAGRELLPRQGGAANALVRGAAVELARGTSVAAAYDVPGVEEGRVDVEVEVVGYYDPTSP
jgi:hypothetical protein